MSGLLRSGWSWCAVALWLAACSSTPLNRAPVDDIKVPAASAALSVPAAPVHQPPGFENAGKPGYYSVKPGDTLIRIALETGQHHKDLARWNNLDDPNKIEVGQVLRVVPPVNTEAVAVAKPVQSSAVTAMPLTAAASAPSRPASAASAAQAAAPLAARTGAADEDMGWIWPAEGKVLTGFDESKNKGVDIAGKAGDPVLAAADGRVVYAGGDLRGYGNLIIIKHSNSYLTAYAHNQKLLVKEDQSVKKGQKIAEMGSTDADRVKLHFELRKQDKPVDPVKYLPAR